MTTESWPVKKPGGEQWGHVAKLIIDPQTRQISHADVLVDGTQRLVRVAWGHFQILNDAIMLRCDNPPIVAVLPVKPPAITEPTMLEVSAESRPASRQPA